jgi:hypothetical protein
MNFFYPELGLDELKVRKISAVASTVDAGVDNLNFAK